MGSEKLKKLTGINIKVFALFTHHNANECKIETSANTLPKKRL